MATTDNLGLELLSENALQIDPIVNESLGIIDECLAGATLHNFTADENLTLTDEYLTAFLRFTDGSATLTTGRDVIYPESFPLQVVTNDTAQTLTLKVSGETGITLSASATTMIYANGTDVVEFSSGGGFANPMTTAGDIIIGGASGAATRLAAGTDGYVLKLSSGAPVWAAESAGSVDSVNGATGTVTLDAADVPAAINAQTGTTYTLVLSDASKVITMNNASANTLTIPPNASVAIPIGHFVEIWQTGAGQTTIAEGSGVTINYNSALTLSLAGQHSGCSLRKIDTNTWQLTGDMEAA